MKKINSVAALLVVFLSVSQSAYAGTVTFSDSTFDNANWITQDTHFPVGGDTVFIGQAFGGNPGEYRAMDTRLPSGGELWRGHIGVGLGSYSLTAGSINSINFSFDALNEGNPPVHPNETFMPLVRQNGQLYVANGITLIAGGFWTSFSATGLTSADFKQVVGGSFSVSSNPDFSSTGGDLEFGVFTWNDNVAAGGRVLIGFDNLNVSLNTAPVPEPSTWVMFGLGILALMRLRRA